MTKREFIDKFGNEIILATQGTPLFPSVKMAQAIIESNYGNKTVGPANNLFGIKATGSKTPYWDGSSYNAATGEHINGADIVIRDNFRAYKTWTDSIKDHSYLLMTLSRYQGVREAKTPEDQARAIKDGGYATDQNYVSKLLREISDYNLKGLDKKKAL